jgi:hypothetical protein
MKFPLTEDLVSFDISANISNFVMDQSQGKRIEARTLRVVATKGSYQISGLASIDGTSTKIDLRGKLPATRASFGEIAP